MSAFYQMRVVTGSKLELSLAALVQGVNRRYLCWLLSVNSGDRKGAYLPLTPDNYLALCGIRLIFHF